jgi:hypothetical protein
LASPHRTARPCSLPAWKRLRSVVSCIPSCPTTPRISRRSAGWGMPTKCWWCRPAQQRTGPARQGTRREGRTAVWNDRPRGLQPHQHGTV